MKALIDFLQKEFPDGCSIITPQFERTEKLKYEWIPENKEEFYAIINKASWEILKGFGFGKWSKMNDLIAENAQTPEEKVIHIPIINGTAGETYDVDIGSAGCPILPLEEDEMVILFPGEWYDIIPDEFIVTGLDGEGYPFKKGESDDDIRFGCLPYGIRRKLTEFDKPKDK